METATDDSPRPRRRWLRLLGAVVGVGGLALPVWFLGRYSTADVTEVAIAELPNFEYREDPAGRSPHHGQYQGHRLRLVRIDDRRFDFVFEPTEPHVARVTLRNIDASLLTPGLPKHAAGHAGLRRISLTDREWNRQQVHFPVGDQPAADGGATAEVALEIEGGDGWERDNLAVVGLAKNCLNAGLWEVLLFTKTDAGKELYYQGWFTFPMGHYKRLWEQNTGLSYWDDFNFWRMEHWVDPAGNEVPLDLLREVLGESEVAARFDPEEPVRFGGEQTRKRRTTQAPGVRTWGDLVARRDSVRFATFRPPGVYDSGRPWKNRYGLIAEFEGCTHRQVRSRLKGPPRLDELELRYRGANGERTRLIIGGLDLSAAPQLPPDRYPDGVYLPMGIGTPPFFQDYAELAARPPHESPYYSFFLDERGRWIDHHTMAIDGPVLHRDPDDPTLVHLYLLSYERHQLVAHYELPLPPR